MSIISYAIIHNMLLEYNKYKMTKFTNIALREADHSNAVIFCFLSYFINLITSTHLLIKGAYLSQI